MLSVILPRWDEPTVIELTKDNLKKELVSLPDSQLIIANSWAQGIQNATCDFICLVEPDCLVSSGYFVSNYNLFKKNKQFRKLAMMSSSIGLNNWGNRIYGYHLEQVTYEGESLSTTEWEVQPMREKKSTSVFPIQISFLPGAIIRKSVMEAIIKEFGSFDNKDLVKLSTEISFFLWGTGRRININPNTTYVSTLENLDSPTQFKWKANAAAQNIFLQEQIQ